MSLPSQFLSDYRSRQDQLDYDLFRPALLDIILNAPTPLTLGIFGSWGTGKTSLMEQLKSEIASRGNPYQRAIWFTAWKYEHQDALWRAFLLGVIDGLYPHKESAERCLPEELPDKNQKEGVIYLERLERSIYEDVSWTEAGKWNLNSVELVSQGIRLPIWLALQAAGLGEIGKGLGIAPDLAKLLEREVREHHLNQINSLEQFAARFEESIRLILGKEGRLIVFVDDLDRCLPEKAVQILEAIKLFMDVPGVVFVLGMDRLIVRRGIETYYGAMLAKQDRMDVIPIDGDSYLQKMIQIPFYLPPLSTDGRLKYINSLLEKDDSLDDLTRQVISIGVFPTPRQIKRVLNIFFLLRQIADAQQKRNLISAGDVSNPLLAKAVLIQSQWPELYQVWRQHPGLIQALEDHYLQNPLSEEEHLYGRDVSEFFEKADQPQKEVDRTTAHRNRRVTATGLMAEYVNNRQTYALLGSLLCYPSDPKDPNWAQCHFSKLTLKQLNNYIGLVGAPEAASPVPEPNLPEDVLNEIQSGDPARLKTLIARVRDEEVDPNGPQHQRLRQQMLKAMQSPAVPAIYRAAIGAVLAEIGDPRPEVLTCDAMAFCEVPAGDFIYGEGEEQKTIFLPGFWIGKYPVTVAQFDQFVQAGGYTHRDYWDEAIKEKYWTDSGFKGWLENETRTAPDDIGFPFSFPNHPVVGISWYEAMAYTRWLQEKLLRLAAGRTGSPWQELAAGSLRVALPTDEQWEKAARGTDGRIYPWGNEFDPDKANILETGIGATSAVGCFPGGASPYGAMEMSGNVREWVLQEDGIRGGSWFDGSRSARCASRYNDDPDSRDDDWGFRVSLSPH
ncbi:MAG TPA: SUMF1/EgtB/PvdO family nonheme iron enzyme [Anaerolineaceae bacterium]|nr:SUMF1/EgtB/PvdO family nonheme iron enzyme [Anaerolineaceae bacterium]